MLSAAYIILYMISKTRNFIFDVDGTLTESRKTASSELGPVLRDLQKLGKIFIVSGSDIDFILEQLKPAMVYLSCKDMAIMGCNGTKKYKLKVSGLSSSYVLDSSLSMRKKIGKKKHGELVEFIIERQLKFLKRHEMSKFCTGNFVSNRETMINWSPLGRDGDKSNRKHFIDLDRKTNFRKKEIKVIKNFCEERNIDVKISYGGQTSFDMFPVGWDKTIALEGLDIPNTMFFGDRCEKGGNDHEIHQKIKSEGGTSYHVKSPEETLSILKNIIKDA